MIVAAERKTRRLFFALWPGDAVREALAHATRKAVRGSGGRPIPVANWHMTLAFLGSVGEDRVTSVMAAAGSLPFVPFQLRFDRLEHWAKAAVLCATASEPPLAAKELVQGLQTALVQRGFTPDLIPWRAHMTLARKVVKPRTLGSIEPIPWSVEDFVLVESQTLPEGARYTVLARWPS